MGFFDLDRWNEVWQTIQRNKKRSIMTAFGVFWGVFMLTALLGFGMGLGKMFESSLGNMSSNTCFFFSGRTSIPYKGMPIGRWWNLTNDDIKSVAKLDGVRYVAPIFWGRPVVGSRNDKRGDFYTYGNSYEYQQIDPQKMLYGRFISELDVSDMRKVCVLGVEVYRGLFTPGEDPVGQTIKVNGGYYRVIGVAERINRMISFGDPEKAIHIPSSLFQQIYGFGNIINAMAITGENDVVIAELQEECRKIIAANHIISADDKKAVDGFNLGEFFGKFQGLFYGITFLTWIVGLGTLLAGIVGVSNIMLVVVRERTQEIGVRRALGAKPIVIISQILSESFVLTFIAGIFGLAAGVALLSAADATVGVSMAQSTGSMVPLSFQVSFWMGLLCAGIVVAGSLVAGIIPASRALTIKAVDALRDE